MGKAHSLLAEVTCGYTVVGKTQPVASVRTGLFCSTRGDLWRGHLSSLADWLKADFDSG